MRRLILFDIDGTILWTDGAGRNAIRDALLAEMGTAGPVTRFRFDGKTDPQIVAELLTAADHPAAQSEASVMAVCRRYVELLELELQQRTRRVHVFEGVQTLFEAIEARADALLGLLTGNVERGAALKLTAAGIDSARFRVGAYGSDSPQRAELPAIAASRAAPIMGRTPTGPDVVIIGDTPADMTCGRGVGARAIGVATGAYSVNELMHAGAYAAFETLSDTARVLDAIEA